MAGPVRNLLLHLEVRPAGKRCRCARDEKHVLVKGDTRFVVKAAGPIGAEKGYCSTCAAAMISKARTELDDLQALLGVSS